MRPEVMGNDQLQPKCVHADCTYTVCYRITWITRGHVMTCRNPTKRGGLLLDGNAVSKRRRLFFNHLDSQEAPHAIDSIPASPGINDNDSNMVMLRKVRG